MIKTQALLFAVGAVLIAAPALAAVDCKYKGIAYSHGSASCQSGSQYRCDDGQWSGLSIACTESSSVAPKTCSFDGNSFSAGAASCQLGTQYRCDDGAWLRLAATCTASDTSGGRIAAGGRTCLYNGATVATESTICKSGITFRCEDGEWHNLGSACR